MCHDKHLSCPTPQRRTPPAAPKPTSHFRTFFRSTSSRARKPGDGNQQSKARWSPSPLTPSFSTSGSRPKAFFPWRRLPAKKLNPATNSPVSVQGRDPEGYYTLTRFKVERPKDWSALEKAFADKATIVGTVTGAIKGGLSVDIGVRAFMPISRSGARDAAEVANLVGQEIRCRIMELDVADENVVVDRRGP